MPVEVPVEIAPALPPAPRPTAPAPVPAEVKGTSTNVPFGGSAELRVRLPSDARLFIDDHLTRTTGSKRDYRSPELAAGTIYAYELRAEITRNGQTTTQTKLVHVQASESAEIAFDFDAPQVASVSER